MITINIAGLNIGLDNRYPRIEEISKEYLTDASPDFIISVSDAEISKQKYGSDGVVFSDNYCESLCIYRKIAEILPKYDAFVFHGCVLAWDGNAHLFTAKSGVGKTTHARNLISEYGNRVHILNGDKPIIRFMGDKPFACGTPWRGKENYGINEILPLTSITFVERDVKNVITEISKEDATVRLMSQIYLPMGSPLAMSETLKNANRILNFVPLSLLKCTKEQESAKISFDFLNKLHKEGK